MILFSFAVFFNTHILVRCIDEQKDRVVEGELRCKELAKFLDDHGAKKAVWMAEDGTATIEKISYDPKTNQLVGIVLPLNGAGCPIPFRWFVFYILLFILFISRFTYLII